MTPLNVNHLEDGLASSSAADRKAWAQDIIQNDIHLPDLFPLLEKKYTVRSRFIWLLSDIGEADPLRLRKALPALYTLSQKIQYTPLDEAFARYWLLAGVPLEQEGLAIDRMFQLLQGYTVNVSIKFNAHRVLENMIAKYPELRDEWLLALEDQLGKHTENFDKVIQKTLSKYRKNNP